MVQDLIGAGTLPTSTDEAWALRYFLRPNWAAGIQVVSSYETDIQAANSAAEQRRGLRHRPLRSIKFDLQAVTQAELMGLKMTALRAAKARLLVPLFPDATTLTAATTTTDEAITVADLADRRFFVGQRLVVVAESSGSLRPTTFAVATIDGLDTGTNEITLTDEIGTVFAAGAFVYPLLLCQPLWASGGTVLSDLASTLSLEVIEQSGQQLPELAADTYSTYQGYPILPATIRHMNFGVQGAWNLEQLGTVTELGLDTVYEAYGDRARFGLSLPFDFTNRSDAFDMIRFWESRRGRLYPFWAISPQAEYTVTAVAVDGTTITVSGNNLSSVDWESLPYVAVSLTDGSVQIREITTVTPNSGTFILTLAAALSPVPSLTSIARCGMAYLARFNNDSMTEHWLTDQTMSTVFEVVETLQETAITVDDIVPPTPGPGEDPCDCGEGTTCYLLTRCFHGDTLYTSTEHTPGIADLEGMISKFEEVEGCWYVEESATAISPQELTPTESFTTCVLCLGDFDCWPCWGQGTLTIIDPFLGPIPMLFGGFVAYDPPNSDRCRWTFISDPHGYTINIYYYPGDDNDPYYGGWYYLTDTYPPEMLGHVQCCATTGALTGLLSIDFSGNIIPVEFPTDCPDGPIPEHPPS